MPAMKVTVVGSGFVGATTAMRIVQKGLADEVVLDRHRRGASAGLALDIGSPRPSRASSPRSPGRTTTRDTAGSDVIVITAGFPRQPGMSRMDLLGKNAAIMRRS